MLDFNGEERGNFDLIPANTLCKVAMVLRPAKPGAEGKAHLLTQSQSSDLQFLDVEFTVLYGPFANRKIWQNIMVDANDNAQLTDGQKKSIRAGRGMIMSILESARKIDPKDETSPQARAGRQIADWHDLNGLEFACKVGVEKDKTGQFGDKNKVGLVITNNKAEYSAIMAGHAVESAGSSTPAWGRAADSATSAQPNAPAWANSQPAAPAAKPANNAPAWAR